MQPSDRRGLQADTPWPLDKEQAVKMYRAMVGLQTMDVVFYDSQRQAKAPWRGLATAPCLLRAQPRGCAALGRFVNMRPALRLPPGPQRSQPRICDRK